MSGLSIEEEQYILRKIKDLDFLQERDEGNIDRLFDMIDKRDEKINKLEKDISKLRKVNNSLHDEQERLVNRILQRHNELADNVEKMNNRLIEIEKHYLKWENLKE